jgi:AcrR family transcriptional regulator
MKLPTRPYQQVARAEARRRTHDAIIDAAEAELRSGRWEEATLEEIAVAAGVTKTTLLRHFRSKSELLAEGADRATQRVRDQRWQAPTGDVAGAVDNLLEHYEHFGELGLIVGAASGSAQLHEIGRRARRMHYDWIDHAFAAPLRAGGSPAVRRRRRAALIALCDVHTWWLLSHDLEQSGAEVRATLIQAIEGILREG